jgi:hypothetical protein
MAATTVGISAWAFAQKFLGLAPFPCRPEQRAPMVIDFGHPGNVSIAILVGAVGWWYCQSAALLVGAKADARDRKPIFRNPADSRCAIHAL